MQKKQTPLVFMLEQDADDRELTEIVAKETGYHVTFKFFNDPSSFFNALLETKTPPQIIILNYNLVVGNVLEILHALKSNSLYRSIPVIVLSETASRQQVEQVYAQGANSFITKPFTNNETVNKISGFFNYWFNIVELPQPSNQSVKKSYG